MTTLSMYSASVPVMSRMLENLLVWLDKAHVHAQARGFEPDAWLQQQLAPDMLNFARQVQVACDTAKGCATRLAGEPVPSWEDTETTLEQLRARVRRTLDLLQSLAAERFEGAETREVVLSQRGGGQVRQDGLSYLQQRALPNFFFHITTAYALLRQGGVDIGKADYLGR